VDTGSDFDLVITGDLRDRLRSGGLRSTMEKIQWGRPVAAERYALKARIGAKWADAEALFPLDPRVDENLIGLSMLRFEALCIRPALRETWVGRAPV
jgi:hypothetical protein